MEMAGPVVGIPELLMKMVWHALLLALSVGLILLAVWAAFS